MTTSRDVLLWVDTETTAIRPEEGELLEIGMRVTDMTGNPLSGAKGRYSRVIHPTNGIRLTCGTMEPILGMHRDNGLIRESLLSGEGPDETAEDACQWVVEITTNSTPTG